MLGTEWLGHSSAEKDLGLLVANNVPFVRLTKYQAMLAGASQQAGGSDLPSPLYLALVRQHLE